MEGRSHEPGRGNAACACRRHFEVLPPDSRGQVGAGRRGVVLGDDLSTSWGEQLFKTAGSLGFGSGGILTTDRSGQVVQSWDPKMIGHRFVDPATLSAVPVGQAREGERAAGSVTLVSPIASVRAPDPFYAVFSQPESALFADLRQGRTARDLSLLGLVVVALALMAFASWRRETDRAEGRPASRGPSPKCPGHRRRGVTGRFPHVRELRLYRSAGLRLLAGDR